VSEVRRRDYDAKRFLNGFLSLKKAQLELLGVPKGIASKISKDFSIVEGNEISKIESREFWEKVKREKV